MITWFVNILACLCMLFCLFPVTSVIKLYLASLRNAFLFGSILDIKILKNKSSKTQLHVRPFVNYYRCLGGNLTLRGTVISGCITYLNVSPQPLGHTHIFTGFYCVIFLCWGQNDEETNSETLKNNLEVDTHTHTNQQPKTLQQIWLPVIP
jgi:uncharacterized membrane protein